MLSLDEASRKGLARAFWPLSSPTTQQFSQGVCKTRNLWVMLGCQILQNDKSNIYNKESQYSLINVQSHNYTSILYCLLQRLAFDCISDR